MKHTLLFLFTLFTTIVVAQQTTHSWDFDGETRQYIQYVPSIYDGSEAVPLILSLHGLGDNMNNMANVGFHQVADTANIIVVTPEALVDQVFSGATAWNSGAGTLGISLNGDVDDVGFLNAIIDTVSVHFNIDQNRIYATGFSMGGFMSNRLACELNNRIASIASVAGTVGGEFTCTPGQEVPVCHFHGTADTQVGYGTSGGGVQDNGFGNNAPEWIDFWNNNNGCGSITMEGAFPNTASDGYDVEYYEYAGCTNASRVVHYKVNGADHVWLGPNNDIFYTVEIWKFFLGLSPSNLSGLSVNEIAEDRLISIYPNPASDVLNIENVKGSVDMIEIFDTAGRLLQTVTFSLGKVDVSELETGAYFLNIHVEDRIVSRSFLVQ